MLKSQLHELSSSEPDRSVRQINNDPPPSSDSNDQGLDMHEMVATGSGIAQHDRDKMQSSTQGAVLVQHANLPPLVMFGGKGQDDGEAFNKWCCKLDLFAQLKKWNKQDKLLQFELHLTGRAELVYGVLHT